MVRLLGLLALIVASPAKATVGPAALKALDSTLTRLAAAGEFSGAVVIRTTDESAFARGYGWSDPFARRPFTSETSVDSASLAKPVIAAAVLALAKAGMVDLDAPVARYVGEFPYKAVSVRQLLSHSAGLPGYELLEPLSGKTNADLLRKMKQKQLPLAFLPGSAFSYCNSCYDSLALLVERVSGTSLMRFAQQHLSRHTASPPAL